MNFTDLSNQIFERSVFDYHKTDNVDAAMQNPFAERSIEYFLYLKNYIDTVQWHLEDIIRDPNINPLAALALKRRIDKSNQDRTDLVELIDSYFLDTYRDLLPAADAKINTESPAWAIDRLSILHLKIYHMQQEASRQDTTPEHRIGCEAKLKILFEQKADLTLSIQELIDDIAVGRKKMRVYRQMKMYNDPALNPILYKVRN